MYFDGSLKLGGAGVGVLFISLEGKQFKYVLQIMCQATNNEAEYLKSQYLEYIFKLFSF
jgi:ribonuclease HI